MTVTGWSVKPWFASIFAACAKNGIKETVCRRFQAHIEQHPPMAL